MSDATEWVIIYAIVAAVACGLLAVGLWVVLP